MQTNLEIVDRTENDEKLLRAVRDRVSRSEDKGSGFVARLVNEPSVTRALLHTPENREFIRRTIIDNTESISDVELAGHIKCSVANVRAMRQAQTGPPFYFIGRLVRYKMFDVLHWLEEQTTTNTPKARATVAKGVKARESSNAVVPMCGGDNCGCEKCV